jgi:hypothetical protein
MSDEGKRPDMAEALHSAFSEAYGTLEREAAALRRQVDRQARLLANAASRERVHYKLIEDQYQLLRSSEASPVRNDGIGPVLTIPVQEAMGLAAKLQPENDVAPDKLQDWLTQGAETDRLIRPIHGTPADAGMPEDHGGQPGGHYLTLRRPMNQTWRPSPGLAAFSLKRGELRALGFNLIGASDERLDHLAEEIAQSAALNRRFAPVIFTTTRAGLNSFRSRRLTYESLPVFSEIIARQSGIRDARTFYDLRVGYLVRKWRIQGVMNMGRGYEYTA